MDTKRLLKIGRDVLLVAVVFAGVSAWQTRHHLGSADPVPRFEVDRLDGASKQTLPAAERRSLLYFFAPWCGVCKLSAGNLATVRRWNGDEAADVVAVALDYESVEDVRRFVDEHEVGVDVLLGNDAVRDAFRVDAYPTYYVIDAEGRVEHVSVGYSSLVGMAARLAL